MGVPSFGIASGRARVAERSWSWFASRSRVYLWGGLAWDEARKLEAIDTAEDGNGGADEE